MPGNLDEQIGPLGAREELLRRRERALGVIGKQRRDFERDTAVDAAGLFADRPEEIGGLGQVGKRDIEEQRFARRALGEQIADRGVIGRAALDRVIENGRVRGKARHRPFVDITLQRAAGEEIVGDVVEPDALAEVVKLLGRFHVVTIEVDALKVGLKVDFEEIADPRNRQDRAEDWQRARQGRWRMSPWRGNMVVTSLPQAALKALKMRNLSSIST